MKKQYITPAEHILTIDTTAMIAQSPGPQIPGGPGFGGTLHPGEETPAPQLTKPENRLWDETW